MKGLRKLFFCLLVLLILALPAFVLGTACDTYCSSYIGATQTICGFAGCPSGYVVGSGACIWPWNCCCKEYCTDSDGEDPNVKGSCMDSIFGYIHQSPTWDTCTADLTGVRECYCVNPDMGGISVKVIPCPAGSLCQNGACVPGSSTTTTMYTTTTYGGGPPPGPVTTPTSIPCSPTGGNRCQGMAKQVCTDRWTTVENPSEYCCTDGDCSTAKCLSMGGDWLEPKVSPDFSNTGYCCGDEGNNDLGKAIGADLCVYDTTYKWIHGVNATRYVGNRIIFCQNKFLICFNETPYYLLNVSDHCTNKCNYYCEPQFNKWLSDTVPEGLNILSEPVKTGEQIDTEKFDFAGKSGCCPSSWCWNGTKCIENQIDEPLNIYVLNDSTKKEHRCQDGNWVDAKQAISWGGRFKGYCPNKDSQCLVGNFTYASNNKPDLYFTNKKPQCIGPGQYIFDYYCGNHSKWISRTSLLAAKMLELGGTDAKLKLFCDVYTIAFNDFDYSVVGGAVWERLGQNCKIHNQTVACANNVCVMRSLDTPKTWIGASLNVNPCSSQGIGPAFNLTPGCSFARTSGPWGYLLASPKAIYNPNVSIIIYSSPSIQLDSSNGWTIFKDFLSAPIETLSQLILHGQIKFRSSATLLKFDVLNSSKMMSKVFVANYGTKKVQGIFEENRYDETVSAARYYLLIKYEGFSEDICGFVNSYAPGLDRENCNKSGTTQVVLDSRQSPSFLMAHWTDLTSKFK